MGSIHTGDCVEVMAQMEPESVDAIVTDPPYGIGFMGKAWDAFAASPHERKWNKRERRLDVTVAERDDGGDWGRSGVSYATPNLRCANCGKVTAGDRRYRCQCGDAFRPAPQENRQAQRSQAWHQQWAEAAYRVAKPSAYLLAFGGTRTFHRLACALEDAGWIIRDTLVWAYLQGFPKSRASLKPSWEPIVLARKPGPLRDLDIDGCRIPGEPWGAHDATGLASVKFFTDGDAPVVHKEPHDAGRWPPNVLWTDDVVGYPGVIGGGPETSRVFLIPKADRADREPVLPHVHDWCDHTKAREYPEPCQVCGSNVLDTRRCKRCGVFEGFEEVETPLGALGNKFCTLCGESWVAADGWPKCGHGRENTGRRPPLNPKSRANVHPTEGEEGA